MRIQEWLFATCFICLLAQSGRATEQTAHAFSLIVDEDIPRLEQRNMQTILRARGFHIQRLRPETFIRLETQKLFEQAQANYQQFDFKSVLATLERVVPAFFMLENREDRALLKSILLLKMNAQDALELPLDERRDVFYDFAALFGEDGLSAEEIQPTIRNQYQDTLAAISNDVSSISRQIVSSNCEPEMLFLSLNNGPKKAGTFIQLTKRAQWIDIYCGDTRQGALWLSSSYVRRQLPGILQFHKPTQVTTEQYTALLTGALKKQNLAISTEGLIVANKNGFYAFSPTGEPWLTFETTNDENSRLVGLNQVTNDIFRFLDTTPIQSTLSNETEKASYSEATEPPKWVTWATRAGIAIGAVGLVTTSILLLATEPNPDNKTVTRRTLDVDFRDIGGS